MTQEYKSFLSMIIWRFMRGLITGSVSTMIMVNVQGVNTFQDLHTFLVSLSLAGIMGGITGGLLAVDKWIRSVWVDN